MADILDLDIRNDDIVIEDDGIEDEVNIVKLKENVRRRKGRGFNSQMTSRKATENFETIDTSEADVLDCDAQRSVGGWILMVTGVHEEAHEDDVHERFSDCGTIKNLHLNMDRRTGFLKGYALVEYERFEDAQAAKSALDGAELLGNKISVDWAFMKKPLKIRRYRRH